jgi:hypothetical protein
MGAAVDPFSFHPDLRDKISDPLTSPSRTLTTVKAGSCVKRTRFASKLVVFRQRAGSRACRNPCRPPER